LGYIRCTKCGHRLRDTKKTQGSLDNGLLDVSNIYTLDQLTKKQISLTLRFAKKTDSLLDIGSGTGKFLFYCKKRFSGVCGIEVSSASVQFSRKKLDLRIIPNIHQANGPLDVVTAWHSLEHIPSVKLLEILKVLKRKVHYQTRILVCLPNPDSLSSRVFGLGWAFRDKRAHFHEFSRQSVDLLFAKYGFTPLKAGRIFVYSLFCYLQSFCNAISSQHNYIYYRFKRGVKYYKNPFKQFLMDLLAIGALCCISPLALFLTFYENVFCKETAIHFVIYSLQKNKTR
jgi:SAM-dependent methyltransferase